MTSSLPDSPSVEPVRTNFLFASPPKGRTARRRSRSVVRSGAHAIEKARERSLCNTGGGDDVTVNNDLMTKTSQAKKCDVPAEGSLTEQELPKTVMHIEQSQHRCEHSSYTVSDTSFDVNQNCDVSITSNFPSKNSEGMNPDARNSSINESGQGFIESQSIVRSNSTCYASKGTYENQRQQNDLFTKSPSKDRKMAENTPTITVGARACGRDATAAQDIGNYRMLIDDLSYLCSAVIQSRKKPAPKDEGPFSAIHMHSPVTAGAACDIAELVSQSGPRSKLLIVSAEGARVGALGAVLESIACAPQVLDMSATCSNLVDGPNCICGKSDKSSVRLIRSAATIEPSASLISSHVPDGEKRGKYDAISSKALSIVAYFVGIDCTVTDKREGFSSGNKSCVAVQFVRESVLRHKPALLGIARLVANDPLVRAYLLSSNQTYASRVGCTDDFSLMSHDISEIPSFPIKAPPPCGVRQFPGAQCDPTKLGRRRKKRKQVGSITHSDYSAHHSVDGLPSSADKRHCSRLSSSPHDTKGSNSLDLSLEDGRVEPSVVDKYEKKILLAFSRTKWANNCTRGINSCNSPSSCQFCSLSAPHMISPPALSKEVCAKSASSVALVAAHCIITGRDKLPTGTVKDHREVSEDLLNGSDLCNQHLSEPMSRNPLTYANEMLRLSGSLPYYSWSMCETLVAILLSLKPTGPQSQTNEVCTTCSVYLQQRASQLSDVIDSLCCLSPSVSAELSHHKFYLVPSLLRAVAETSFAPDRNQPFTCCDSICTVLKTLTSLTHENAVACKQILQSYQWKISLPVYSQGKGTSGHLSGLDIVFCYLLKTASLSQSQGAFDKARYDSIIFSLNILTNIVEMMPDPTCSMIERIPEWQGSMHAEERGSSGLLWLTQWLVDKTAGFQNSVMRGTFGSKAVSSAAADINELEAGDDDNLVTVGNGFVLLACLLIHDGPRASSNIRDTILSQLPLDGGGNSGGIQFMIRTLKAFCNFYHYSVGEISVAVIAPIVKLIAGLEVIDKGEQ